MSTFGERLKLLRTERRMYQEDLGKIVGLSKSAIGTYERNEREPTLEMLHTLSKYFDVTIDYLTGNSDERKLENVNISSEAIRLYKLFESIPDGEKKKELEKKILSYANYLKSTEL
ncbi:helix-turn-helix domain-containing protein [Cytobacillus sp. Hm23]